MRRRNYLRTAGLMGLAILSGCSGSDDTEEVAEMTDTPTATEPQEQTTETTSTETTQTETETPTAEGEPQVTILGHELVVDEGEYTTDVYVAAKLENEGDAPTGMTEITAKWYDADGNYLDDDTQYLQSLGAGETWAARVYYLGGDTEKVDDYELDGEFGTEPPQTSPEGLEMVESEMEVGEDEVLISGNIKNNRDEAASYIQATGKVYNGDGVVLGDEWTNATDVPAGETWAFELKWRGRDRVEEAADHAVWVTDSAI